MFNYYATMNTFFFYPLLPCANLDYKWVRGFDPALIHSAHYICHSGLRRAVHQFLSFETKNNVELFQYLFSRSSVGSNNLNKSANVD